MTPMTAIMRMNAVTSNGSRFVVNSAAPKSCDASEDVGAPTGPASTVGALGDDRDGPAREAVDQESQRNDDRAKAGPSARGIRIGPDLERRARRSTAAR